MAILRKKVDSNSLEELKSFINNQTGSLDRFVDLQKKFIALSDNDQKALVADIKLKESVRSFILSLYRHLIMDSVLSSRLTEPHDFDIRLNEYMKAVKFLRENFQISIYYESQDPSYSEIKNRVDSFFNKLSNEGNVFVEGDIKKRPEPEEPRVWRF